MSLAKRRFMVAVGVVAFVVLAPIIIGVSLGYRFDPETRSFMQVGGIHIESHPRDATVWINDEVIRTRTPAIVRDLTPSRSYQVRVERDGSFVWEKELPVFSERVTAARNVTLFPTELSRVLIEHRAQDTALNRLFPAPSGEQALGRYTDGTFVYVSFSDVATTTIPLAPQTRGGSTAVSDVHWAPDEDAVIFALSAPQATTWFHYTIDTGALINLTALYEQQLVVQHPVRDPLPTVFRAHRVGFAERETARLFAVVEGTLLFINLDERALAVFPIEEIVDAVVTEERVFVVRSPDVLIEAAHDGTETIIHGGLLFEPEHIYSAPDARKIVFYHRHAVGVMWVREIRVDPFRIPGEQELIMQSPHAIEQLWWHGRSEHILTRHANNDLIVSELDGRGQRNVWSWDVSQYRDVHYLPRKHRIFVIDADGTLWQSEGDF